MDNIRLLQYCVSYPEKFLDYNYMFVKKDSGIDYYKKKTIEIKELLTTIKRIRTKKSAGSVEEQIFVELQQKLKKYANYSEFGCFINACDSNINENINDLNLLKRITHLYLEKRDLCDITPSEWLQAIIDKGSSRKKGHAGENKLITILEKRKFAKVKTLEEFDKNNKCVAKFAKSGDFSNKNIKKHFKISIGKKTQGKKLDIIIKRDKDIYFLEAKHLNVGGGEQNKQVLELIEIIDKKPLSNHHFVSFLDGIHSNDILKPRAVIKNGVERVKEEIQYNDIRKALTKNKNNYWINTAGFIKLFHSSKI